MLIKTIRQAIMSDEEDKVFTYIDLLNFTTSINMIVKLCNALQKDQLAMKVSKLIADK